MFMSPELINQHYGKQSDIWSCGVLMFIMLCGQSPFKMDVSSSNKEVSILVTI